MENNQTKQGRQRRKTVLMDRTGTYVNSSEKEQKTWQWTSRKLEKRRRQVLCVMYSLMAWRTGQDGKCLRGKEGKGKVLMVDELRKTGWKGQKGTEGKGLFWWKTRKERKRKIVNGRLRKRQTEEGETQFILLLKTDLGLNESCCVLWRPVWWRNNLTVPLFPARQFQACVFHAIVWRHKHGKLIEKEKKESLLVGMAWWCGEKERKDRHLLCVYYYWCVVDRQGQAKGRKKKEPDRLVEGRRDIWRAFPSLTQWLGPSQERDLPCIPSYYPERRKEGGGGEDTDPIACLLPVIPFSLSVYYRPQPARRTGGGRDLIPHSHSWGQADRWEGETAGQPWPCRYLTPFPRRTFLLTLCPTGTCCWAEEGAKRVSLWPACLACQFPIDLVVMEGCGKPAPLVDIITPRQETLPHSPWLWEKRRMTLPYPKQWWERRALCAALSYSLLPAFLFFRPISYLVYSYPVWFLPFLPCTFSHHEDFLFAFLTFSFPHLSLTFCCTARTFLLCSDVSI